MTVTLTKPGDEVTMLVKSVATVESTAKAGTFRYQIDGTLASGKEERVYLNTPVVDKQLSHLILAEATDLVGDWYRFYRVAAPNNTPAAGYLNIEVASKGSATPAKPSQRLTAPASLPDAVPAHHRDVPLPQSPDGDPDPIVDSPVIEAAIAAKRESVEAGVRWALDVSFRALAEQGADPMKDLRATCALAATVLIAAQRRGAD